LDDESGESREKTREMQSCYRNSRPTPWLSISVIVNGRAKVGRVVLSCNRQCGPTELHIDRRVRYVTPTSHLFCRVARNFIDKSVAAGAFVN